MTIITALVSLMVGLIGGFVVHAVAMKIGFKQRTIDNKIKVYDSLIKQWVRMRNTIYAFHPGVTGHEVADGVHLTFDKDYGDSQALVAEAYLLCDDEAITAEINAINERFYRTEWATLELSNANAEIEQLKKDALALVVRMREDIKRNTAFEREDLSHMWSSLWKRQ